MTLHGAEGQEVTPQDTALKKNGVKVHKLKQWMGKVIGAGGSEPVKCFCTYVCNFNHVMSVGLVTCLKFRIWLECVAGPG